MHNGNSGGKLERFMKNRLFSGLVLVVIFFAHKIWHLFYAFVTHASHLVAFSALALSVVGVGLWLAYMYKRTLAYDEEISNASKGMELHVDSGSATQVTSAAKIGSGPGSIHQESAQQKKNEDDNDYILPFK